MKILVSAKVVPDLEMLSEEDWKPEALEVDTRFAKREWNCFDESALEMTLRFADAADGGNRIPVQGDDDQNEEGSSCRLTSFTLGDKGVTTFLKTLLALKFDHVVKAEEQGDMRFRPYTVAGIISSYVKEHPQDLILMGRQSGLGDNGQTPALTAELLGYPCITQVSDIQPGDNDTVIVTSKRDDGIIRQRIVPPCVLAVGNAENSYLRVPTLKDKMKFGKREIESFSYELSTEAAEAATAGEDGFGAEGYQIRSLEQIDKHRAGAVIAEGTPKEKASSLYHSYLKKRLRNIWNTES